MYDWLVAAVLGIVQALTEFLPISSSAHVRIVGELMLPGDDPGAFFTAIIQIGTEAAVVVYFWRDIVTIISKWCKALVGRHDRKDPEVRLGWLIIVGSIPIVVIGLLFQDHIEGALRSLWITATMLIVFGIIIGITDWAGKRERTLEDMTWGQGILFGFAQARPSSPACRVRAARSWRVGSWASTVPPPLGIRSCSRSPRFSARDSMESHRRSDAPMTWCSAGVRRCWRPSSPSSSASSSSTGSSAM